MLEASLRDTCMKRNLVIIPLSLTSFKMISIIEFEKKNVYKDRNKFHDSA